MKTAAQIRRDASDAAILAARFPQMLRPSVRDLNFESLNADAVESQQEKFRAANKSVAGGVKKLTLRTMSAPALNKTEQRWQDAHPCHHPFPVKLRWGKCMVYSPDFLFKNIVEKWAKPILIEVKGGWIESRDICRFKGCAAEWGWLFDFRMMQWKDRKWTRIY